MTVGFERNVLDTIEKVLSDNFTTTPIGWSNRAFTPPTNKIYILPQVLFLGATGLTLGWENRPYDRHQCEFQIKIIVPKEAGLRSAYDIAAEIKDIYLEAPSFTTSQGYPIHLKSSPIVNDIGEEDTKRILVLRIPFYVESRKIN